MQMRILWCGAAMPYPEWITGPKIGHFGVFCMGIAVPFVILSGMKWSEGSEFGCKFKPQKAPEFRSFACAAPPAQDDEAPHHESHKPWLFHQFDVISTFS
jgi:hypothetical protein